MDDLMARLVVEEHLRRAAEAQLVRQDRPGLRQRTAVRLVALAAWLHPAAVPSPSPVVPRQT